jgi:hypothetical protein
MTQQRRELYASSNGDAWYLCRDGRGHLVVEHVPNLPSGGKPATLEIGAFLSRGAAGPEHQALLRLIGTLLDGEHGETATRSA